MSALTTAGFVWDIPVRKLKLDQQVNLRYYNYAPEGETSSVAFMALWKKCDVDKNGFLDQVNFLLDINCLLPGIPQVFNTILKQ